MITKEILMRIDLKKVAKLDGKDTPLFEELVKKKDGQLNLFA